MQRTLGTVFIAVLVVLAGCNGVLGGNGDDEPMETIAPAPVPTDEPTPTPVPQLAPGLTGEGIENARTLVAAHTSILQNTSFVMTSNTTTIAENGSVLVQRTSTFRAGPSDEGFYFVSERNGSYDNRTLEAFPVRIMAWSDGDRVFLQQIFANGTTTYDRSRIEVERLRYSIVQGNLGLFLESLGTANTVVEPFTRNGTTLYRVRGIVQIGEGNRSVQLLVDSRGVIRRYRMVNQVPFEENVSRSITKIQFSRIGATDAPERPSWVDEALNQTTPIPENPRRRDDETATSTQTNETATKTTSG